MITHTKFFTYGGICKFLWPIQLFVLTWSRTWKKLFTISRYIVGLAGPPGAGKSTLASEVVCRINKHWSQKTLKKDSAAQNDDTGIVLPMDGFHLYCSQLDAMEVRFSFMSQFDLQILLSQVPNMLRLGHLLKWFLCIVRIQRKHMLEEEVSPTSLFIAL